MRVLNPHNPRSKSNPERDIAIKRCRCCSDGVQLSGLYIAASNCIAMIQSENEVDVVQTVLGVKKSQPHFISSLVLAFIHTFSWV